MIYVVNTNRIKLNELMIRKMFIFILRLKWWCSDGSQRCKLEKSSYCLKENITFYKNHQEFFYIRPANCWLPFWWQNFLILIIQSVLVSLATLSSVIFEFDRVSYFRIIFFKMLRCLLTQRIIIIYNNNPWVNKLSKDFIVCFLIVHDMTWCKCDKSRRFSNLQDL